MNRRIILDIKDLIKNINITIIDNNNNKIYDIQEVDNLVYLLLKGPSGSDYDNLYWKIKIIIPINYPYIPPSISFITKIYHPNIDLVTGEVCLDEISKDWTPVYTLSNIFEYFIPELLLNPIFENAINSESVKLYNEFNNKYLEKIQTYNNEYAYNKNYIDNLEF